VTVGNVRRVTFGRSGTASSTVWTTGATSGVGGAGRSNKVARGVLRRLHRRINFVGELPGASGSERSGSDPGCFTVVPVGWFAPSPAVRRSGSAADAGWVVDAGSATACAEAEGPAECGSPLRAPDVRTAHAVAEPASTPSRRRGRPAAARTSR